MASLFAILGSARDGIFAATGAMDVTSQNVAGASVPGYVRRTAQLESTVEGGVSMTGTARSFDQFSYSQLVDQESQLSAATTRAGALADVESLVSPATDTLSDRANALLSSLHDLSLHPTDTAVRTSVLSSADWLAKGFSDMASGLSSFENELYSQSKDIATELTSSLKQLSALDKQIVSAQGMSDGAPDLRDQRDQLVRSIALDVGARAVTNPNGSITLYGAGTVLYDGGNAATVDVALDTSGKLVVQATRDGQVNTITSGITSGKLGGVLEARDQDIPSATAKLDSFAYDVSTALNAIHASGYGLDGVSGRPLFTQPTQIAGAASAMSVDASLVDHPELLAASGNAADLPGGNDVAVALANAGNISLGGLGTMAERYGALANDIGVAKSAADGEQKLREDTVATASTLRESVSGVSIDEEMIQMQQFQRGFEASSKVMKTVSDLFDTLMSTF